MLGLEMNSLFLFLICRLSFMNSNNNLLDKFVETSRVCISMYTYFHIIVLPLSMRVSRYIYVRVYMHANFWLAFFFKKKNVTADVGTIVIFVSYASVSWRTLFVHLQCTISIRIYFFLLFCTCNHVTIYS